MFPKKKIIYTLLVFIAILGIPSRFIPRKNDFGVDHTKHIEIPLLFLTVKSNAKTFQDKRDGKFYREIKIGNQTWMAENLNYGKLVLNMEQSNNKQIEKSYYKNDTLIGQKMGALYTWEEAMNYGLPNAHSVVQGICPDGWHLPSNSEWEQLCAFLDPSGSYTADGWSGKDIALVLIDSSQNTFHSKFAGNAVSNWYFYLNNMSYYWTSTKYSSASAYYRCLSKDSKKIYKGAGDIKIGMSVRCIKDQ